MRIVAFGATGVVFVCQVWVSHGKFMDVLYCIYICIIFGLVVGSTCLVASREKGQAREFIRKRTLGMSSI